MKRFTHYLTTDIYKCMSGKLGQLLIIGLLILLLDIPVKANENSENSATQINAAIQSEHTVTGTIRDSNDEPLIGATIAIKGSSEGTITNLDGTFSISVPNEETVLVISSIGYLTEEIKVGNQSIISISLIEDITELEKVVVIGYGTQKRSEIAGAVAHVEGSDLNQSSLGNSTLALQGKVPGVRVEAQGGAPGANAIVTIRGSGTLSDQGPLYIIDGVTTGNMNSVHTSDIESISVLKDASATAIYGSRAANGVILITTKKGKVGEVGVELDMSYGIQQAAKLMDWADAKTYANIHNRARVNDGRIPAPANDEYFDPNSTSDLQSEYFRSGFDSPMKDLSINVHGGGENGTYNFSINHLDQIGIVRPSDFKRTTVRANSTFTKGRLKITESLGFNRSIDNPINWNQLGERDLLPTIPMRDENGDFLGQNIPINEETGRPVASSLNAYYGVGNIGNHLGTAILEDRTNTRQSLLGNLTASFEIIKGLSFKTSVGTQIDDRKNYTFTPEYYFNASSGGNTPTNTLRETRGSGFTWIVDNTLNYKKTVGKHTLEFLLGYSAEKNEFTYLNYNGSDFPNNDIRTPNQANQETVNSTDVWGAPYQVSTLASAFFRVNYNYDSRYLLTITGREDKSSVFAPENNTGRFPSAAVGWNLGNESFMENLSLFTYLKIRASWGRMGANNVNPYAIDPTFNSSLNTVIGGNRVQAAAITDGVDRSILWETTTTTDIGLEFGILKNKLQFTIDYFDKKSADVLTQITPPHIAGYSNDITQNAASLTNKGIEFSGIYKEVIGDMTVQVNANITYLQNEVDELSDTKPHIFAGVFTDNLIYGTKTEAGQPIGSFYGYEVLGIYQNQAEINADTSWRKDIVHPGDFRFANVNGDSILDNDDRVFLGSGIPKIHYGFTLTAEYKGIDILAFFNGVAGNKILNGPRYRGWFAEDGNFLTDAWTKAWTEENPTNDYPRNTLDDPAGNRRMSSFYLENGAYFRLRNLQIGYSLPQQILDNIGIRKIRFYFSMQNVFTITKYTGYYPEVGRGVRGDVRLFSQGVDEKAYPTSKSVQLGIQASF